MDEAGGNKLPRESMLKSKIEISKLLREGRYGYSGCIKYCVASADESRIMVSVSKRIFKRAVKRNLMKRRMREAFRTQRQLLGDTPVNIMFVYAGQDVLPSEVVRKDMAGALERIAAGKYGKA